MTVQLKVSSALEALAVNNQAAQEAILEYDAANFMIRLMEVNINEFSLWERNLIQIYVLFLLSFI